MRTRNAMTSRSIVYSLATLLASMGSVQAQSGKSFYEQKQVRLIIGQAVGGDYDAGGRLLAKYLGRHIPGEPSVVVQNMPGAASVVAANFLFNIAPHDGSLLGSFSRNLVSQTVLGAPGVLADFRQFNYLGGTSEPSARVCAAWRARSVKSTDDLFRHELIVAGAGVGSGPSLIPIALNNVLGTKFKLVEGYAGTMQANLAMERGEVEGVCRALKNFDAVTEGIRSGEIKLLLQLSADPIPEYPSVPSVYSLAKTQEERQMLRFILSSEEFVRPYVFPPNVPQDRVEIMRRAIAASTRDPELVAEAKRLNLDMAHQPAQKFIDLVNELYSAPPALVERVKKIVPIEK